MYNQERKDLFLSETSINKKHLTVMLDLVEKFEIKNNKDVCEFSNDELQEVFDAYFGTNIKTLARTRSMFIAYRKWCASKGFNTSPDSFDINFYSKQKYTLNYVASAKHLKRKLDSIFDPPERLTLDCVFRAYFWFAFMGIPDHKAFDVRVDQVDLKEHTIEVDGVLYEIPQEAVPEITNCCTQDYFIYIHNNPYYEIEKNRVNTNTVLRGYKVAKMDKNSIYTKVSKTGISLSYLKIQRSGLFAMIRERSYDGFDYKLMIAGIARDRVERLEGRDPQRQLSTSEKRYISQEKNSLIFEYESWLKAFP